MSEKAAAGRVLLLVRDDDLFLRLGAYLEQHGIKGAEWIHERGECPLVLVDDAYFEDGTAQYLRRKPLRTGVRMVLVRSGAAGSRVRVEGGAANTLDDILIVRHGAPNLEPRAYSMTRGDVLIDEFIRDEMETAGRERADRAA